MTIETMEWLQEKVTDLRKDLDTLGAMTIDRRTPPMDHAYYACYGPLEVVSDTLRLEINRARKAGSR